MLDRGRRCFGGPGVPVRVRRGTTAGPLALVGLQQQSFQAADSGGDRRGGGHGAQSGEPSGRICAVFLRWRHRMCAGARV
ncbi:MAG: hypothetical protein OXC62_12335 [Aestuariivita sp.]|nr:hypothetical protein [Aestuariivita sp.]